MKYKEADFLIESYINYFNFILRTNIEYYKKKKIQEVEIRRIDRTSDHIKLINFYLGEVKSGINVQFYEIQSMSLLTELKEEGFIELANIDSIKSMFKIRSIEEMHKFFKVLERTKYFLSQTTRLVELQ